MSTPIIRNGKFHAGKDCTIGENVVVEVAEEVVIGDRCVITDNTYFGGRRVEIGSDFYGYGWEWKRLDIGRGRIDEEDAILTVGSRCTFHDNRIDLARRVTIGDDVGLSPEVVIYTHGYWQSMLDGFSCDYEKVEIWQRSIIGFRSLLLPGAVVENDIVVGAQSTVTGRLFGGGVVFAGCPAKRINAVRRPVLAERQELLRGILEEYERTVVYRFGKGQHKGLLAVDYPVVDFCGIKLDVEKLTVEGEEDERSDDLRDFLFKRGIRIYTKRRFKKLGRK